MNNINIQQLKEYQQEQQQIEILFYALKDIVDNFVSQFKYLKPEDIDDIHQEGYLVAIQIISKNPQLNVDKLSALLTEKLNEEVLPMVDRIMTPNRQYYKTKYAYDINTVFEIEALKNALESGMKELDSIERIIVSKLFGLNGYKEMSQEEVASELNLHLDQIQIIRDSAYSKLKNAEDIINYIGIVSPKDENT